MKKTFCDDCAKEITKPFPRQVLQPACSKEGPIRLTLNFEVRKHGIAIDICRKCFAGRAHKVIDDIFKEDV